MNTTVDDNKHLTNLLGVDKSQQGVGVNALILVVTVWDGEQNQRLLQVLIVWLTQEESMRRTDDMV